MTRIIAGQARGRHIETLAGAHTRPTGDRVRQTLFDIFSAWIPGCRFLDLCAGSGAVGLEAWSRGAGRVVLVEHHGPAAAVARRNAERLGRAPAGVEVRQQEAVRALADLTRSREQFDLIYLDPPYASDLYESLLAGLGRGELLADGGRIVVEHFHKRALPETIGALARCRSVRIGERQLTVYACRDPEAGDVSGGRPQAGGVSGGRPQAGPNP